MTNAPLRVAVAGAGMVTRHHLIGWSRADGAEVVAICNRSLDKARDRAAEFGVPKVYGNLEEMLDTEKPDALDIAVAVEVHAEAVCAAAARGISVFCQKPLTPTYAEAQALVAEIGERVPFMVHENWRFRPQYRQAAAWIAEGRVGPVRLFAMSALSSGLIRRPGEDRTPALLRQPFMAGLKRFIVFELLIHHLDVVRHLVGQRLRVAASSLCRLSPEVVGEDTAHIALQGEDGAAGTVTGSFVTPGASPRVQDRLELIGEQGRILFEGDRLTLADTASEETVPIDIEAGYQGSYDAAIAHFVGCLRAGRPFETDRLDNLETLRLVEEAYTVAAPEGFGS